MVTGEDASGNQAAMIQASPEFGSEEDDDEEEEDEDDGEGDEDDS